MEWTKDINGDEERYFKFYDGIRISIVNSKHFLQLKVSKDSQMWQSEVICILSSKKEMTSKICNTINYLKNKEILYVYECNDMTSTAYTPHDFKNYDVSKVNANQSYKIHLPKDFFKSAFKIITDLVDNKITYDKNTVRLKCGHEFESFRDLDFFD